jgi:hypothetical protein
MAHRSQDMPAWRAVATALAAFAVGVQLLLSGVLIGHLAWAADRADATVICAHDQVVDDAGGGTPARGSHDLCPACACPQSAPALLALAPSPGIALPLPRSEVLALRPGIARADLNFRSPYASRAPPRSA